MPNPIERFFEKASGLDKMPAAMKDGPIGKMVIKRKGYLLAATQTLGLDAERDVQIIGSHHWEAFEFPVVKYSLPNGSFLVVRDNFANIAVFVKSIEKLSTIVLEAMSLSKTATSAPWCEGFPENLVFEPYVKNQQEFTTHFYDPTKFEMFLSYFKLTNQTRPEPREAPHSGDNPAPQ